MDWGHLFMTLTTWHEHDEAICEKEAHYLCYIIIEIIIIYESSTEYCYQSVPERKSVVRW